MTVGPGQGWAAPHRTRIMVALAVAVAAVGGAVVGLIQGSASLGWALAVVTLVILLGVARIEVLHRRVIRRLEGLRKRDVAAQAQLAAAAAAILGVASSLAELRGSQGAVSADRTAEQRRHEYAQIQSALWLFSRFRTTAPVATMRGWAASPDFIELMIWELIRNPPAVLLECGSGVSTLWAALAVDQLALPTRVVSLEHQDQFAEQTRRMLVDHGVEQHVDLRVSPLVQVGLPSHTTAWYDPSCFADLRDIGLVLVDGPPTSTGPVARMPALPLLHSRLSADAVLILDDADRADERAAVASWVRDFPDFRSERIDTEKGAVVMRRLAPVAD